MGRWLHLGTLLHEGAIGFDIPVPRAIFAAKHAKVGGNAMGHLQSVYRSVTIVLCATVLTGVGAMRANAQSAPAPEDVWKGLRYKTGWIIIGLLTADTGEWAAGVPGFEILGDAARGRTPVPSIFEFPAAVVLPKRGDRIRLLGDHVFWILDFKISGEKNRLVSPTTRRRSETTDETGIELPRGSELIVRDVQLEKPAGGLKTIWLRISPP